MRSRRSPHRNRPRATSRIPDVPAFERAIVIVLDSVGIGDLPDAARYGDQGSNTLAHIAQQVPLKLPTLRSLGLSRLAALGDAPENDRAVAACGRMAEA